MKIFHIKLLSILLFLSIHSGCKTNLNDDIHGKRNRFEINTIEGKENTRTLLLM